ncbi:MAG: hypothetical protein Q9P14_04340 [candidate division KSB1 bacterium]|nr:hypothetical protein [candidate division KSB1 bacterium]
MVTTTYKHTGAFASKVQAHWNRNPIDFDGDGKYEIIASFQGNQDSITTTTYKWNEQTSSWDTTVTKIANPKSWFAMRFEFTGSPTGIYEPRDITFVTPGLHSGTELSEPVQPLHHHRVRAADRQARYGAHLQPDGAGGENAGG